jgi:ferredoxin
MKSPTGLITAMAQAVIKLSEADQAHLTVDPAKCLHSRDRFATCTACVQACPVQALSLQTTAGETTILLHAETCVNCGLCPLLCPVGAFDVPDSAAKLLAHVSQQEKRGIVELACALHPQPEIGPPQSETVLCTTNCLAALGPAALMSLFALGVGHLLLRLDVCHACPLGKAQEEISKTAAQVNSLMPPGSDRASPLTILQATSEGWPARPVARVNAPPKSRRDFFRSLVNPQEHSPAVRQLMLEEAPPEDKYPPRERRRLRLALAMIPDDHLTHDPLQTLPSQMIAADENCTACGLCARSCPTGAMQFAVDEADHFQLSFAVAACTNCEVCLHLCEPEALQLDRPAALADWFAPQAPILYSGDLKRCPRCGTGFAAPAGTGLCPVCEFRRQNPFGSRLPDWYDDRHRSS